ncbi:heavy metal translocating P-type ATPase [Halobacillus litoralis]|uniref:Cd(2+)-exporting ATPase n=1 Tax=Halobacillus litoralis TaxID=45668 RepID=A0A410MIE8_9BACI|nr:heavy metal translocating P-type ATPase [Halobacillus litoralis]QAS54470.1 heavy metal translocating P-type ATPase [Halobacillus litoralis]
MSELKKNETSCCSTEKTEAVSCCVSDQTSTASSCCSEDSSSVTGVEKEYRVTGMDCPSCAQTIEKNLMQSRNIREVNINYSTAKMKVKADQDSTFSDIPAKVKKLGFEAAPVEQEKDVETYSIEGMDCGSCAKTIEKHLMNHPKVKEVSVNFSTGKMQIDHTTDSETIMKEVQKSGFQASLFSKTESAEKAPSKKDITTWISGIFLTGGFVASFTALPEYLVILFYATAIVVGGWKPAKSAFYSIKSRSLDMNVLMASAALGAALIGEWFEGAMVVWLFALGNTLQNRSIERTRDSIRSLIDLTPSEALVKRNAEWVTLQVKEIAIGDTILVKPGEKFPLDGEITKGSTSVNQAPITGESLPVDKNIGDTVYAGTVNENGSIEVHVTKLVEDTTIANIIHLVEEAQEKKAPTQAFVDRFANVYTPIVFLLALLVMVGPPLLGFGTWGEWVYKGLALLVVACPCALVISTPVAIVSAIGNAARNGVLIKGGTFLEKAGTIKAIAFDKTGTLTEGKPKVTKVFPINGSPEEMLSVAHTIEARSSHPIAQAITDYAKERSIEERHGEDFEALAGKGAKATIEGLSYFAGNLRLYEEMNVSLEEKTRSAIHQLQQEGHTVVIIGTAKEITGFMAISDTIRPITKDALLRLKASGIEEIVMLTGDNRGTAAKMASLAGVDRSFSELLPEDKVTAVKKLQSEGKEVAMVGDGINDAPALATADLGIAMGGAGTDTAMETADIVLMADNLEKLPYTIRLSRRALKIIKQNVWFALITKFAALILIFPGILTLWMAVLSDTGAALIVILNSMRLLKQK